MLERRSDFVLHHLHAGSVADDIVAILDLAGATNVETHRGIEFERITAGRGFRITVHHANFHAKLIDEDHHAARTADRARQFAQRLRHQTRLQADMAVAHFTFDFRARHQCRHRIDDQHIDGIRAHQCIDDFQRLLTRIGLRHNQLIDVYAQLPSINRIERMFGVHKGSRTAALLRFGDDMQRQCGLARAFRPVNFDDATARQSAHAQGDIEAKAARRNRFDLHGFLRAKPHGRALAKSAVNLRKCGIQCLLPVQSSFIHGPRLFVGIDQFEHCRHHMVPCQAARSKTGRAYWRKDAPTSGA